MQYAVFNPESGKHLGRYYGSDIRSAKINLYEDAGYKPHEVTEEMLSCIDASPVPLSDNEDRMNVR